MGEREIAVKVEHVSVRFNLSQEKVDSLKEFFLKFVQKQLRYREFWALRDVSFSLCKGDRIGILGLNGAGKSTLLKVIAGVYKPTEGSVKRKGVIAPLLELGAGFDPQYTARENIYLYGAVLGYSKAFIDEKFDEIVSFSELEKFLDVPLKNFSSGMKSRLGFAICTAVNPDILILDEVLSVGDARFKKKSMEKIRSMFDQGVTVLLVSHSLSQVRRICNKALILENGTVRAIGGIDEVGAVYEEITEEQKAVSKKKKKNKKKAKKRKKAARLVLQKGLDGEGNGVDRDKPAGKDDIGEKNAPDHGGGADPLKTDFTGDTN